jgi:SAM-dependent methyltransferase
MSDNSTRSNDGQIEYWNSDLGKNWARYQEGLDACFYNINNRLIELCAIEQNSYVLDVGCGTGATSIALSEKANSLCQITGLDVSEPLLDYASNRIETLGLDNIQFLQADAQTWSFAESSYDLIASRFGVMFFTNPQLAFQNLFSSLKSGGSINFTAWSAVENNPWFCIPRDAAVAQLGKGKPTDAQAPGPIAFADVDYVNSILTQAGLTKIDIQVEEIPIETSLGIDTMTELACNLGPAVRLMKEKNGGENDAKAIKESVTKEFLEYSHTESVTIPASIVVVRAQ